MNDYCFIAVHLKYYFPEPVTKLDFNCVRIESTVLCTDISLECTSVKLRVCSILMFSFQFSVLNHYLLNYETAG